MTTTESKRWVVKKVSGDKLEELLNATPEPDVVFSILPDGNGGALVVIQPRQIIPRPV